MKSLAVPLYKDIKDSYHLKKINKKAKILRGRIVNARPIIMLLVRSQRRDG